MPTATNKGILRLVLVSASNLKCPRGKGKIDPYSEVSMGADQEQKTPIVSSTCNPKWNSNMQFFIKDPRQDVLCITVFDKDYFSPNGKYELKTFMNLKKNICLKFHILQLKHL